MSQSLDSPPAAFDSSPAADAEAAPIPREAFDLYLLADRRRFQRLALDGRAAVVVIDEDHTLCYLNPVARAAFSALAPASQPHLFSLVHREDLCEAARALRRLRREPSDPASFLARLFVKRSRWRWFSATAARFTYRRRAVTALFFEPLAAL